MHQLQYAADFFLNVITRW